MEGFKSSINYNDEPEKMPVEAAESLSSNMTGFTSSIDYSDDLPEEGVDGAVAKDPSNSFEPMPKDWNKGEDSYPMGEYGDALRRRDWEVVQTNKERTSGFDIQAGWQEFTKGYVGKAVDTFDYLVMKPVLNTVGEAMGELGGVLARSIDAGDGSVAFDNETGKQVRDYVQDKQEDLGKWWMTLDKNTRKNIEGLGLLSSIMPASFATKPVKAAATAAGGAVRLTRKSLMNSLAKEKSKSSLEMITVPRNKMNAKEKFNHQKNTDVDGNYKPNADELAEMKAIEELPHFKTKSSAAKRDFAINDGVNKQSAALDNILKKDGTVIDPDSVRQAMDSALDEKIYQNTTFSGVAELDKKGLAEGGRGGVIETMRSKADTAMTKAIADNGGVLDSFSLNKARQAFDNAVTEEKIKWSPNEYSLNDEVWLAVRKGMNDIVDDSSINRTVKSRRENVSRLISARNKSNLVMQEQKSDHIFQKAFHAISGVGRTQYLGQILANAAGAAGAVSLAGGIKGGIAMTAAVGGAGLGFTWVGSKMLMSRIGRKTALAVVSELDSAMKVAKTASEKLAISKAKKDMINLMSTATLVTGGVAARNGEDK